MGSNHADRPLRTLTNLLRTLRAAGVAEYRGPDGTHIRFDGPRSGEPADEPLDPAQVEAEGNDDPRFFLEQLHKANAPKARD